MSTLALHCDSVKSVKWGPSSFPLIGISSGISAARWGTQYQVHSLLSLVITTPVIFCTFTYGNNFLLRRVNFYFVSSKLSQIFTL